MKVVRLINALLCASAAVAVPGTTARRLRRTSLPQLVGGELLNSLPADNATHLEYTQNWAGAVLIGTEYSTVSGTIVIPKPSIPVGGSSARTYSASAWVGIDGSTCQSAILQTGVDFNVRGGVASFEGWYEWYPDYSYTFSNFKISFGDTIAMSVTATGRNSGSVTLENKTTGQVITHSFSNQNGNLCRVNAEWIVEDFSQGNSLVPFANFDTVTFTDVSVNGRKDLSGATIYDIKQGNRVYTSCSTPGSNSYMLILNLML
ncbi:peptidase A4 family-domain-containing protein [Xylariaceae sp. FL1651]|nr:peptidase A4 family-domain-containing protein [Xylariaceae sp. FL1651]